MEVVTLEHIAAIHKAASDVSMRSNDHGPNHWKGVAIIGHALWAEGVEADPIVLLLFAAAHDTQRISEWTDPDHGERAANVVTELQTAGALDLRPDQASKLDKALRDHDRGSRTTDPTIGACWDADRLTLTRVGITPTVEYMSSAKVQQDFDEWSTFGAFIAGGPVPEWETICNAYKTESPLCVVHDWNEEYRASMEHMGRSSYALLRRVFAGGELCDELKSCLHESEHTGQWIMHPLVHTMYHPLQAEHYNRMLKVKKEAVRESLREGKFSHYVFLHERPYRIDAFMQISQDLSDDAEEWWAAFRVVWTDTENMWQNCATWRELLEDGPETDNPMAMDDDERKVFDELPSVVTVYRGTCAPDAMGCGLSWTLDRERAEWFARRLWLEDKHDAPRLLIGKVKKAHIIAYVNARQEDEIVTLSDHVELEKVVEMEIPT